MKGATKASLLIPWQRSECILWLEYIGVGRGASVTYNVAADNLL